MSVIESFENFENFEFVFNIFKLESLKMENDKTKSRLDLIESKLGTVQFNLLTERNDYDKLGTLENILGKYIGRIIHEYSQFQQLSVSNLKQNSKSFNYLLEKLENSTSTMNGSTNPGNMPRLFCPLKHIYRLYFYRNIVHKIADYDFLVFQHDNGVFVLYRAQIMAHVHMYNDNVWTYTSLEDLVFKNRELLIDSTTLGLEFAKDQGNFIS